MSEKDLESFIRENRNSFEMPGPRPDLWDELESKLPVRRSPVRRILGSTWLQAAAVLLLLVNAVLLYQYIRYQRQPQGIAQVTPELQEAKVYYTSQIEQRLQSIRSFPPETLGLDSTARKELELRNDTYRMLEKELIANPGNERIRSAMVRYYQMKLDLLDRILDELQEKHTPNDKPKHYAPEI